MDGRIAQLELADRGTHATTGTLVLELVQGVDDVRGGRDGRIERVLVELGQAVHSARRAETRSRHVSNVRARASHRHVLVQCKVASEQHKVRELVALARVACGREAAHQEQ